MAYNFFRKTITQQPQETSLFEKMIQSKDVAGMYDLISYLPNPDIILRKTGKGLDTLRKLTNHYQVGTCIDSRKAGVTSLKFELLQGNTPQNNFEIYQNIFDSIDIYSLLEDILDAPLYGFAPIEITWEKDGDIIIPTSFEAEPQEWFKFNSDGQFFFKHKSYPDGLLIEPELSYKFLLPKNKATKINPYGQCILSRCFWNVAFINGGMEFWVKFMEKYGMPYMFGKYDRSMNKDDRENLLQQLINMVQDAVGVIPADGSVEILNTGDKASSAIYNDLITKCENNISKSILGQTLTTDVGSVGSFAASKTHNEVRKDIVTSDKRLCIKTFNKLIEYINDINFGDKDIPTASINEENGIKQDIAERDNKIYSTGFRFTKSYMMKTYNFAENDIEEVLPSKSEFSEEEPQNEKTPFPFNELDSLLEVFTPQDFEKMINPIIKPVVDMFLKSSDANACMDKLAEIYPQMDTEELEKNLTKVMFISDLLAHINEGKND